MPAAINWTPENEALADLICDSTATTAKGVGQILEELGNPINPSTFYRWLARDEELCKRYARAKSDQARVLADEITQIADNTQVGEVITEKADGIEIKRADMLEHRKLRIESRKWLAAKLLPKVYGERTTFAGDQDAPLEVIVRRVGAAKDSQ